MAICKYFQEGRCRFGDRCFNEHVLDRSYGYQDEKYHYASQHEGYGREQHHSPNRYKQADFENYNAYDENYAYNRSQSQNRYVWRASSSIPNETYRHQPSQYDSPTPPFKPVQSNVHDNRHNSQRNSRFDLSKNRSEALNEQIYGKENVPQQVDANVLQTVIEDMIAWDEGKQWPFSCYCPFKGYAPFPNFTDVSPEELRQEAYEAIKNNSFPAYVKSYSEAASVVKLNRERFKNPDEQTTHVIHQLTVAPTTIQKKLDLGNNKENDIPVQAGFFSANAPAVQSNNQAPTVLFGKPTSFHFSGSGSGGFSLGHLVGKASKDAIPENMNEEPVIGNLKSEVSNSAFKFISQPRTDFSFKLPAVKDTEKTGSILYTPAETLTAEENEAFSAPVFILGKIPCRPPPHGLCF